MDRVQFTLKESRYIQQNFQKLEKFETHDMVWVSEEEFNRRLNSLWTDMPRRKEQLYNLLHTLTKSNKVFEGKDGIRLFP